MRQLREQFDLGIVCNVGHQSTYRTLDKSVFRKTIFLISQPKHMLWALKRTVSMRRSYEQPKHMLKQMGKKIFTILRSKILFMKPVYISRRESRRQLSEIIFPFCRDAEIT